MARPQTLYTGVFSDPVAEVNYNSIDTEEDLHNHAIGRTAMPPLEDLAIDEREPIEVHPVGTLYEKIIRSIDSYNKRAGQPGSGMKVFPDTLEGRRDAIYAEVVPLALINEFSSVVNGYGGRVDDLYSHIPEDVLDALLSHI